MPQEIITLNETDTREGFAKWLECERLHEQLHAAEAAFGTWANGMARLYHVPENYAIGDPTIGFIPRAEEVAHDG